MKAEFQVDWEMDNGVVWSVQYANDNAFEFSMCKREVFTVPRHRISVLRQLKISTKRKCFLRSFENKYFSPIKFFRFFVFVSAVVAEWKMFAIMLVVFLVEKVFSLENLLDRNVCYLLMVSLIFTECQLTQVIIECNNSTKNNRNRTMKWNYSNLFRILTAWKLCMRQSSSISSNKFLDSILNSIHFQLTDNDFVSFVDV